MRRYLFVNKTTKASQHRQPLLLLLLLLLLMVLLLVNWVKGSMHRSDGRLESIAAAACWLDWTLRLADGDGFVPHRSISIFPPTLLANHRPDACAAAGGAHIQAGAYCPCLACSQVGAGHRLSVLTCRRRQHPRRHP
jgi:hypothetical protein